MVIKETTISRTHSPVLAPSNRVCSRRWAASLLPPRRRNPLAIIALTLIQRTFGMVCSISGANHQRPIPLAAMTAADVFERRPIASTEKMHDCCETSRAHARQACSTTGMRSNPYEGATRRRGSLCTLRMTMSRNAWSR